MVIEHVKIKFYWYYIISYTEKFSFTSGCSILSYAMPNSVNFCNNSFWQTRGNVISLFMVWSRIVNRSDLPLSTSSFFLRNGASYDTKYGCILIFMLLVALSSANKKIVSRLGDMKPIWLIIVKRRFMTLTVVSSILYVLFIF